MKKGKAEVSRKKEPTAWMIRRDGEAFPCLQHLYGSAQDVEETLYAAEWLYQHTASGESQRLVLDLIAVYGASLNAHRNAVRNLLIAIKRKPYVFLTHSFILKIADKLRFPISDSEESLNRRVMERLNEEFLRARLGGLYHTVPGCRDLYFRVSSNGFDWSAAIARFLQEHADTIATVTIVRDEESTGDSRFYRDEAGSAYDRVPYTGQVINAIIQP